MSQLDSIRARVRDQLDSLTPRDRRLALALMAMLSVVFVVGTAWYLNGVLEDKASRVRTAKENLAEAQALAMQYEDLEATISESESRMSQFRASQVGTYLETWAQNAGVAGGLKSPQEIGSQVVGDYREREYRIQVQRAELEGIFKFLYAIETANYPVKVKSASFAVVTVKDERFLDLNVDLVTYTKEEG